MATTLTHEQVHDLLAFLRDRVLDEEKEARGLAADDAAGPRGALRSQQRLVDQAVSKSGMLDELEALLQMQGLPNPRAVQVEVAAALTAMGVPYADHPAYRKDWAGPKRR